MKIQLLVAFNFCCAVGCVAEQGEAVKGGLYSDLMFPAGSKFKTYQSAGA